MGKRAYSNIAEDVKVEAEQESDGRGRLCSLISVGEER
jgi:hypothetical protein